MQWYEPTRKLIITQDEMAACQRVAAKAHESQTRWDGSPYITHPIEVARNVRQSLSFPLSIAEGAAYLHDVLEDTDVTDFMLDQLGVPNSVIEVVKHLTKQAGETYFAFIQRIIKAAEAGDPSAKIAVFVKMKDIEHNYSDLKDGCRKDKYRFAWYLLQLADEKVSRPVLF